MKSEGLQPNEKGMKRNKKLLGAPGIATRGKRNEKEDSLGRPIGVPKLEDLWP